MILTLARTGQTCNQLMILIAAYALGLKYNETVVNPIMDRRLYRYFNMDASGSPIKVHFFDIEPLFWFVRLLNSSFHRLGIADIFKKSYDENRKGRLQWFLCGVSCKQDSAIVEYQSEIRRFFSFRKEIDDRANKFIDSIRIPDCKLVAVHVRRGDYKNFLGGRFYFSDEEFIGWMKNLCITYKTRFVIFSNEHVDIENYRRQGIDAIQESGTAIDDLCRMSKCDYIMGPPSTYGWFAMIIGDKPHLTLERGCDCSWPFFRLFKDSNGLRG